MADRGARTAPPSLGLWVAAVVLTLAAAAFQRLTAPTRPLRGTTVVDGVSISWLLPRSGTSGTPLRVEIPAPESVQTGTLRFRRFPTDERFSGFSMLKDDKVLVGLLPAQLPAEKLEYYVVLAGRSGLVRIPDERPVVMRFEGAVPAAVLVSHLALLFLAMLLGARAGLEALREGRKTRPLAQWTLAAITLGGIVLGPAVQKLALGAFWTGWPFGEDFSEMGTLLAWLAWVVAVLVARGAKDPTDRFARTIVVLAAVVTFVVYLVPHGLGGSEVDYQKLEAAASAPLAVGAGPSGTAHSTDGSLGRPSLS